MSTIDELRILQEEAETALQNELKKKRFSKQEKIDRYKNQISRFEKLIDDQIEMQKKLEETQKHEQKTSTQIGTGVGNLLDAVGNVGVAAVNATGEVGMAVAQGVGNVAHKTQKRVRQAATYIWLGLTPDEFDTYYAKEMEEKRQKYPNFDLTREQKERLTRRNSKVIFDKLTPLKHGDIMIEGIGFGCESENDYNEKVWGTLTSSANFVWQNKTGALEWLANMNNFFPAKYKGEDTYLIQDAKDMRPPGIPGVQLPKYCYMLLAPADYSNVRKINISGGIRRTRHNRKYKNQKTKKCNQKTRKCRKQKSRRTIRR